MSLRSLQLCLRFPAALAGMLTCCALLVTSAALSHAMVVRVFSATEHQRFDPFPANAEINTSSIFSTADLTGIGFRSDAYPTYQCALVGRQHVVFATHFRNRLNGASVTFINATNQAVTRTCVAETIIYDGGSPSDLVVFRLNAPIDADSGITPLPYYDVVPILNTDLGVTGRYNASFNQQSDRFPLLGKATADTTDFNLTLTGLQVDGQDIQTRVYRFDYVDSIPGPFEDDSDCYLEAGDSGSPSFVQVGGTAALIGVHSAVIAVPGGQQNYDTYVPHYIAELDAVLNPLGYRMRPLNISTTTLSGSGGFTPESTPARKAEALDYDYTLENTGSEVAGNVELQFDFASGEGPDSVTASGWIPYQSADRWTLRRASFNVAASGSVTLSWDAAPSVDTLSFTVTHRSDASSEVAAPASLALADSYADWSSALTLKGLDDDGDGDAVVNLIEYGLGGDPTVASRRFADEGLLLPVPETDGATVTLSHPERSDKLERGLGYALEFSTDLSGWSSTAPAGFSSTTVPYDPEVPGFVQRRWSWDKSGVRQFIRLQVTLGE